MTGLRRLRAAWWVLTGRAYAVSIAARGDDGREAERYQPGHHVTRELAAKIEAATRKNDFVKRDQHERF